MMHATECVSIPPPTRIKSFPSLTAHRAAMISVSLAISQTPVYTARPWIWR